MKKHMILLALLMMTSAFTGCWDAIEIDQRGYVMSLGIDKYEIPPPGKSEEGNSPEEEAAVPTMAHIPEDNPRNRFSFTYVIPNVEFLVGESENPNILYNTVGENLYSASRILTTRINKQVFFGHMKVLVIGETVARDPDMLREVLDAIERDQFISRRISVAIAPDTARGVLEVEPLINPMTGQFMADLFRNKDRSPRSGGGIMGDVFEELHRWGNTVIPRVIPGEEDIKVAGSAVIKNYRLIGWLGEVETRALEIIRGTARPGGLTVKHQGKDEEHIVPIDLIYLSSEFKLDKTSDKIRVIKEVKTTGEVKQFILDPHQDLMEPQLIRELEALVCEKIKKEMKETIRKLQEEFQVDVLGVDHYLSKYHPKLWPEVEEDWDEVFPHIEINVDVETKIRRVGLTK
ncbi:germination protein, Ger(x)C family [Natronincola peptidivorans]|uniref:Germination protein, Ger(X)C family n=1 Tax=Natronincola peptidivorans TaxID=426128 RepID=A0A1I0ALF9_9FIRM|nr:Ger(x)C family spore germination protein [Natronincola peptidivorans]SES94561.1 germination protein, Ger(x)C family [Natronincola peptidivorans]